MSSRSPIRQSARTPPPTLLLPSSLVKEQTSADASPPQTETAKPAKPPPGPLAPAPGDPTVSAPSGPPSMEWYLAKAVSKVNNNFDVFYRFGLRPTLSQYSEQASSFAEMRLSLRLLCLGRCSSSEDFHFRSEEPLETCPLGTVTARAVGRERWKVPDQIRREWSSEEPFRGGL